MGEKKIIAVGYVSNISVKCVYVGNFLGENFTLHKRIRINFGHVGMKVYQLMAAIVMTVKTTLLVQFSPARQLLILSQYLLLGLSQYLPMKYGTIF